MRNDILLWYMRSFNLVGVVAAVAMAVGCCPVADARSGDGAEVSRLTEWFLCGLNDVAAPEAVPDKRLKPEAVAAAQEMVWQACFSKTRKKHCDVFTLAIDYYPCYHRFFHA